MFNGQCPRIGKERGKRVRREARKVQFRRGKKSVHGLGYTSTPLTCYTATIRSESRLVDQLHEHGFWKKQSAAFPILS